MSFKFFSILCILLITFIGLGNICSNEFSKNNLLNEKTLEASAEDVTPPTISFTSPAKCQQYIISKPTIKVSYFDESSINTSSVKLFVNYNDVTNKSTISENEICYTPENKFIKGPQIVRLEVSDLSSNKNTTSFEWYFIVGTPIYNHYRGLLHAHTSASDGHGTYSDAYYLARDKANLDFFAITEHSNMLDNNLECTIENASASNKWNKLIKYKNMFTSKGKFIALNGFEMTYPYNIDNPIGHINIFNSDGFVCAEQPDMDLDNFYNLIYNQDDLIGQFNHPCDKFGKFNNLKYSPYGDSVISLIEVGNGYNNDMNKNIKSYDMYQLALDNGWHLAPTCNQDNHRVDFGIANEFRTVILSTDLSKDALYDSLKHMRVYATEDKNIKIDYTINDLPMGSTISKSSKLRFSISVIDNDSEDKIEEIQVISNKGKMIKTKKFNSNLAKVDFSIKASKDRFYYVKVIQSKNKTSVTAPIWIK
ncbi:CehA/McbA family metallohydrolase [Romboutsia sp.]|uniref:CehA/McbA family metallohydrolase n=1 Tax=Romboutsia sp. TaxID=1965302 RepID=UPI002CE63744|nr:CehA/McbA family metallohydrolase [Romboutsia sp.]HSQ88847.1 CehA/McbA family metallohydrolase [Romboutsia sp.]